MYAPLWSDSIGLKSIRFPKAHRGKSDDRGCRTKQRKDSDHTLSERQAYERGQNFREARQYLVVRLTEREIRTGGFGIQAGKSIDDFRNHGPGDPTLTRIDGPNRFDEKARQQPCAEVAPGPMGNDFQDLSLRSPASQQDNFCPRALRLQNQQRRYAVSSRHLQVKEQNMRSQRSRGNGISGRVGSPDHTNSLCDLQETQAGTNTLPLIVGDHDCDWPQLLLLLRFARAWTSVMRSNSFYPGGLLCPFT